MNLESIREEVATFCDAFFIFHCLFVCLFFCCRLCFFFGPLQMNALQSVSVACAAISAITVYHYLVALSSLMALGYTSTLSRGYYNKDPFFFDSDQLANINFTAKQNSMVAVSSLIILCSIIEIILAVAAIRSSDISGQSSQEQQVREVDNYQILESNKLDISALSTWITLMISQLVSQLSGQSVNFRQIFSSGQSVIKLISHLFNQHVCQHAINKPVADVCLPNCLDDTVYKRYLIIIDLSEGE